MVMFMWRIRGRGISHTRKGAEKTQAQSGEPSGECAQSVPLPGQDKMALIFK